MIEWSTVLPTIVVASIAAGGGWLTTKIQHRGKPENALIDQMQENIAAQDKKIDRLEKRQVKFEARDRVYIPHIIRLNMHIDQELGPPAPKIPKVIADYLEQLEEEDAS